jgi:hypothetical protein
MPTGLFEASGRNEYAAPMGLGDFFVIGFYKDSAPAGAVAARFQT